MRVSYSWLRSDKNVSQTDSLSYFGSTAENISNSHFEFNYSDADFTLGRLLKFGKKTLLRIGVGIEYADIQQQAKDAITQTSTFDPGHPARCGSSSPCYITQASFENKFQGIGPKLSLDGQFAFNKFFSFLAGASVSGLFGESRRMPKESQISLPRLLLTDLL